MNARNDHSRRDARKTAVAVAAAALACGLATTPTLAHDGEEPLTVEARQQLADMRSLTAIYHDMANAEADGWIPVPGANPCLRGPAGEGDMGYHFINVNPDNPHFINATLGAAPDLDPRYPNVLVYEPQEDGSQRLVAVEYVIPFDVWPDTAQPPELFGQQFHRLYETNGVVYNLWELHVWVWRNNPNGLFHEWNPKVSCQYAAD